MPGFFPWWVVVTHFLNIFFMLLLARSGLEVLSAFPKLYWHDDCPPGREWLRLSKKMYSADSRKSWTSLDEEVAWSPVLALPGRKNLGLGRHWHFMTIQFWILTGVVYVAMIFASGYWHYLVPEHWSLFPDSIRSVGTYLQFKIPDKIPGEPFEPAQKLSYFLVVFVLAPLQILTGAAMSPSVLGRFPWYGKLFGGKQGARSLHFIGLVLFAAFTALHTFMVIIHGVPREFVSIVLADTSTDRMLALGVGLAGIALILLFHVVISVLSLRYRRATQRMLGFMVDPFEKVISRAFTSRQRFRRKEISPYHRINGYPPTGEEYERMAADGFRDYRLSVGGLVRRPLSLSLTDLRRIGHTSQITKHNCIQGWTAIAEWAGLPLSRIIELAEPAPEVEHVVFYAMDDKGLTEGEGRYGFFYGTIPLHLARDPQAILALDMNGEPLPVEHGAPLRLRLETQLGFKMVKWIAAIEFVQSVEDIGMGMGAGVRTSSTTPMPRASDAAASGRRADRGPDRRVGLHVDSGGAMREYQDHDATGLAELVRAGEVEPAQLLEAARARAEEVNPRLNAIVRDIDPATVGSRTGGGDGRFAGVPFLLKDLHQHLAGHPTSDGSRALLHTPRTETSTVVQRWLDAGLVVFGKTNTPEFGAKGVTEPAAFGPARNPWNTDHTPGGSSGGSAAAVAAGIVPCAAASDGGGSIRIPASACGLFGLKASRGLVPAGPLVGEGLGGTATDGVVSRSVRDAAGMLDLLAGPAPESPYLPALPARPYADEVGQDPGRLRIGLCTASTINPAPDPEAVTAAREAAELLESLGHEVEELPTAPFDDEALAKDFLTTWFAHVAFQVEEARKLSGADDSGFEADTLVMAALGRATRPVELIRATENRHLHTRRLVAFHETHDFLLTPTTATPPPRIGALDLPAPVQRAQQLLIRARGAGLLRFTPVVDQMISGHLGWVPYTQLANLTGRPAMSVPLHWTAAGLPIGVQFVGALGTEGRLLRLAAQLEEARPWAARRPGL